jgi:hypothetical protein
MAALKRNKNGTLEYVKAKPAAKPAVKPAPKKPTPKKPSK